MQLHRCYTVFCTKTTTLTFLLAWLPIYSKVTLNWHLIIWKSSLSGTWGGKSQGRKLCFYQITSSSEKQADCKDVFENSSESVCTSTVLSFDPLSPSPPVPSAMKTPENAEKDPEQADEGDIIWLVAQPKYRISNKILHVRSRVCRRTVW